jgi:hypothetical protein
MNLQSSKKLISGVDESGNGQSTGAFCTTATVCPRNKSEKLVEKMVELNFEPWEEKYADISEKIRSGEISSREFEEQLENLVRWISENDFMSYSVFYSMEYVPLETSASMKLLSARNALVQSDVETSSMLVLLDGGEKNRGGHNRVRKRFSSVFDRGFRKNYASVSFSCFPEADECYPTVICSDYIAGYFRYKMNSGQNVPWIKSTNMSKTRNESISEIEPLEGLEELNVSDSDLYNRVASWALGKRLYPHPEMNAGLSAKLTNRISNKKVIEYLNL